MGSLYKRGNTWWIKYYRNGKSYRESTGTDKKMVAKKVLDRKEGDIAQGVVPGIQFDKVTFDELAEEFLSEYKINARKSLDRAELSIKLKKGAANGTINRELSALKRVLGLGARQTPPRDYLLR